MKREPLPIASRWKSSFEIRLQIDFQTADTDRAKCPPGGNADVHVILLSIALIGLRDDSAAGREAPTAPPGHRAADRGSLAERGQSMRNTIVIAATTLIAISTSSTLAARNDKPGTNSNASTQAAVSSGEAINGTWKADINSVQFDAKPDEFLLQNGTYFCKSCTPAYSVAADGAFHAVNTPYFDSDAVKVVDDHTIIETSKKAGKQVGIYTTTVSADGNTQTTQFTDTSTPGSPSKGEFIETRVAPAPAGAHAVSGQWKPSKLSNFNDAALMFSVSVTGDTYKSSSPDGTSYEAKIGGGDVPVKGDIAATMASVSKVGENSYQVTRKRAGKVVGITTYTVGADGKLNGVSVNKENGSTTRWTADKQK